jgi:hypothetical protein
MGGVATSLAELGAGNARGDVGVIRVQTGAERYMVKLIWDDVTAKWVGRPLHPAIRQSDGDWTTQSGASGADWKYWGGNYTDLGKWDLRASGIPHVGALYTAGLRLQDCAVCRAQDGGVVMLLSPWFYEFNDADPLVFDNDLGPQAGKTWNGHSDLGFEPSSENIGHGVVLATDGSNTAKIYGVGQYDDGILTSGYHLAAARTAGWDYVKFFAASQPVGNVLGGVPTAAPYTPVKKYLYPTLYGVKSSGSGGSAMFTYFVRWSS